MQALLRSLHRKGHIVIHVTHEYKEAMALATRVGIIEQGKVSQIGTPDDVFHNPKSAFVARLSSISLRVQSVIVEGLRRCRRPGDFCAFGLWLLLLTIIIEPSVISGFLNVLPLYLIGAFPIKFCI